MVTEADNPYIGPRTFTEKDTDYFFGRKWEGNHLLSQIIANPIVLFYSQSGAGKSSLIQTHVVPELKKKNFYVFPIGRVGGATTAQAMDIDNPFIFNLLLSLDEGNRPPELLARISLKEYIAEHKNTLTADQPLSRVLIIDQFEEISTSYLGQWHKRKAFFADLGEAVRQDDQLWVVLTLREEYVPTLEPYASLLPDHLRSRFYMLPMNSPAAIEAIEKPAEQMGKRFTPGVAKELVDNLRQIRKVASSQTTHLSQFVEPVQLQVVCSQLWKNIKSTNKSVITHDDIRELGDVDSALSQFFEEAIAEIVAVTEYDISEYELRTWFEQNLITEIQTRGTVNQGKNETAGLSNDIVNHLTKKFVLRADRRAGSIWYELIHDRFIDPILMANTQWRAKLPQIFKDAEEWANSNDPSKLYKGDYLQSAKAELGKLTNQDAKLVPPLVHTFIKFCDDEQNRRLAEEEEQKALVNALQAKEKEQEAKKFRRISIYLVIAFVFAIAATVTAYILADLSSKKESIAIVESTRAIQLAATAETDSQNAITLRQTAEAASTSAVEGRTIADTESTRASEAKATADIAVATAEIARMEAEAASTQAYEEQINAIDERATEDAQRIIAETAQANAEKASEEQLAQSLILTARNITSLSNDSELGILLTLEAYFISRGFGNDELTHEALNTLNILLDQSYFNTSLLVPNLQTNEVDNSPIRALAFSPEQNVLIAGSENGLVFLWNLDFPRSVTPLSFHTAAVNDIEFLDSETFVTGASDGNLLMWSLDNPQTPEQIKQFDSPILFLSTWPSFNSQIAVSLLNGQLFLVDISTTEPSTLRFYSNPAKEAPRPVVLQIFDTTPTLTVGNTDGTVQRWYIHDNFNPYVDNLRPFNSSVSITSIIPRQEGFDIVGNVYGAANGDIEVLRRSGLDVQISLIGHAGPVNSLSLADNDRLLASAGSDSTVRLWRIPNDPNSSQIIQVSILTGHKSSVLDIDFSPDESFLASSGADGRIRLWQLSSKNISLTSIEDVQGLVCREIGRNMTLKEWNTYLPSEPYNCTCSEFGPGIGADECREPIAESPTSSPVLLIPQLSFLSLLLMAIRRAPRNALLKLSREGLQRK